MAFVKEGIKDVRRKNMNRNSSNKWKEGLKKYKISKGINSRKNGQTERNIKGRKQKKITKEKAKKKPEALKNKEK
jgi:hypothetical protein